MPSAKDLRVEPIAASDANRACARLHYSGTYVRNSQLHLGVFLAGRLEGVMQFGPSLDKRKLVGLVRGTGWNEFVELNRLAFSDALPRNSESRALAVAFRLIRVHAPHLQWVVSFADAAQCGDGTIYRAAGFLLTGMRRNTSIWEAPSGEHFADTSHRGVRGTNRQAEKARSIVSRTTLEKLPEADKERRARESRTSLTDNKSKRQQEAAMAVVRDTRTTVTKGSHIESHGGGASMRVFRDAGFRPIPGFQLRYVYFLDPTARERLTVPVIPFATIAEVGAGMYRGQLRAASIVADAPAVQAGEGGSIPTAALAGFA